MRTIHLKLLVILLLVGPTLVWATEETAPQDIVPNFTGNWVLNEKLSDSLKPAQQPGQRPEGGMGGGGGGGGGRGGRGGRGGGGGGGRGGGGGGGQQPSVKDQQRAARMQQEMSRLEVFHDGIEMNVTNGLDISRLLFVDGRTMSIWTQRGEAKATAQWTGQTLVVQWKSAQDTMSRLRRYTLSGDGRQLTVTEKRRLPQGDKYREMKLVYDKRD